jgi:hypothetical protein
MMTRAGRVVFALMVGSVMACQPRLVVEAGCQPLSDVHCALPYPSNFFLQDDSTLHSGKRVRIDRAALLVDVDGNRFTPTDFLPQDGFSRVAPIVFAAGVGIDSSLLPRFTSGAEKTLESSFPWALINASTGLRVPFFVDVDPRATDPARQAIILRPLSPLGERTRYIVAISGVTTTSGEAWPAPEGFRRLRDGQSDDALASFAHFNDDVFPLIARMGLPRASLQLAWDFTTGSDDNVMHDMLRARSLAMAELERVPPVVRIDSILEGPNLALSLGDELSWRQVDGVIEVPRVLEGDAAGAALSRDVDGQVQLNGTMRVDFTAIVPSSLRDASGPGPVVLYGHGFFGQRTELLYPDPRTFANDQQATYIAIDWLGMSTDDIGTLLADISSNLEASLRFGERLPQAMINWIAVGQAVREGIFTAATDDNGRAAFRRPSDAASNADAPLLRTNEVHMLGISQGHILSGTSVALNPHVQRAAMLVGGAGFAHLMFRSRNFGAFLLVLDGSLPDPLDQQAFTAQLQRGFDRFDPATYAPYVERNELPLGPSGLSSERRVLMQAGYGDAQVPSVGALLHARALGLPLVQPSALPDVIGLPLTGSPHAGSGLVLFDMGVDPAPMNDATLPEANVIHVNLKKTTEVRAQMRRFFDDGVIESTCTDGCFVQAP